MSKYEGAAKVGMVVVIAVDVVLRPWFCIFFIWWEGEVKYLPLSRKVQKERFVSGLH